MKYKSRQQNINMTAEQRKRPCGLVRRRLFGQASPPGSGRLLGLIKRTGIDLETSWVQKHIASCARCQKRFAALNRVNLAMTLLKTRPHGKDLLPRANTQAVDVLPSQTVPERVRLLHHSFAHVAACIGLLVLSKIGIFSTIKNSQIAGQRAVEQLYTSHLDADTADEVFPQV